MEQSFNSNFTVAAKPSTVYNALTNDVCKWWTEQATCACNVGDLLNVRFEDNTHWVMTIAEASPCQSLVWHVTEAFHDLHNLPNKDEWLGTNIIWRLTEQKFSTQISLLHDGLIPSLSCYPICRDGWQHYLNSLKKYLESGQGDPYH
ncbi:SRPBCC domain-containing protein [Thalassotalea sp. M1531]|uniref:SRPBCC domain-containing protein n=1 Tax=Thalassotalea algicola TaxID=2716224 RepID=A0A7Y0L949_9GAMM|nr:SRPBCC domain-containing protein [Thalassotalea algicola]NMP30067.1 SRPBCC domain-containing protein [Thalassotalea algicola]